MDELVKNGIARLPRHAHEIDIKIRDDGIDRYQEGDWLKYLPAYIVAATQAAAERERVAGIRKQIEEIEDISQSRDITENPDGTLLCSHCTMQLETKDEDCACGIIYRKRKERIEKLRAELTGPGEDNHGKRL